MTVELVVQAGHTGHINSLDYSRDGRLLASSGADETVRLWDTTVGCEAAVLIGHTGPVYHASFSPDGRVLASAGFDQAVVLWDPVARRRLRVLTGMRRPIHALCFGTSGRWLVAGSRGIAGRPSQMVIWDCATGKPMVDLDIPQSAGAIAASPDDALIAVADLESGVLLILEAASGRILLTLEWSTHVQAYRHLTASVAFSPTYPILAHGHMAQLRIIDLRQGRTVGELPTEDPDDTYHRLAFRPDGALLAFGSARLGLWNLSAWRRVATIAAGARCMSPDERILARTDGRHVELLDSSTCRVVRRLGTLLSLRPPSVLGNLGRHFSLATNPMLPVIASAAPDGLIRLWDLRLGGGPRILHGHGSSIEALAFGPRGNVLASADQNGEVKLWRVRDGLLLHTIAGKPDKKALCFSGDGCSLYAAGSNGIERIDPATGTVVAFSASEVHDLSSLAYRSSRDGDVLVSAGRQQFEIWTKELERVSKTPYPLQIHAIAFGRGASSKILATAGGANKWHQGATGAPPGDVRLIEPGAGAHRLLTGHTQFVRALSFSPDGSVLVTAGADGDLIAWDVKSGTMTYQAAAHAGGVTGVGFISDGRFIASTGMDGAVRLWQAEDGRLAATLVSVSEEDYVIATDEGHYSATKHGLGAIMLRSGDSLRPFSQYDLRLNRTDRVLARLGYALPATLELYARAAEQRMLRSGMTSLEVGGELDPPELWLREPPPLGISGERWITARIALRSRRRPLHRLMVSCNGVPIHGHMGLDLRTMGHGGDLDIPLSLAAGDNQIELHAVDDSGVESEREIFRVTHPGAAARPTLHAIAVGVSRYTEEQLSLRYAAKDARDLLRELSRLQQRFDRVESVLLEDHGATRAAILGLRRLLMQTTVDDQIILLFAGHGSLIGPDYFFLPSDFDRRSFASTAVSYTEMEQLLDGIPARRRLMLLDTCHAGDAGDDLDFMGIQAMDPQVREVRSNRDITAQASAPRALQRRPSRVQEINRLSDIFADLRHQSGAHVIAAAGAGEYAREFQDLENGVFTSCVIQGLRGGNADRNHDGMITVSELHRFVARGVEALTGGRQRPVSRRENLVDDFVVL